MKTEEDEAFDELARRQGMWGGGFPAKRAMAADKLLEDATRSCNNIDEQRALDALMREAQTPLPVQPAQEPQTCEGRKCQASDANGFEHSSECIVDTAKSQGWSNAPEAIAAMQAIQPALAQPAQEPVSFPCCEHTDAIKWNQVNGVVQCHMCGQIYTASNAKQCFTTPPKREWVGLTDEDRKAALLTAYKEWECEEFLLCAREDYLLIEQALKEKNT